MGHNMRITDLLDKNSISLNAAPADKKETLDLAVELMAKSGKLSDVEKYREHIPHMGNPSVCRASVKPV